MSWPLLIAQSGVQSFETTEFSMPESTSGILLSFLGLAIVFGLAVWTSLRDTRFLKRGWRVALLLLRVSVLLAVLAILINPSRRTQQTQIQKSRVGILVDTSLSMSYPVRDAGDETEAVPSRAEAIQQQVFGSDLLKKLSETHAVSVHTFDSSLKEVAQVTDGDFTFPESDSAEDTAAGDDSSAPETTVARLELGDGSELSLAEIAAQWDEILQPSGAETRLGESLHQLIGELSGRTLSGLIVVTDGRSNAGLEIEDARVRAERNETNLVVVGVGSDKPQVNVWLGGMQAPTDVHRGDPFDVTVTVQGTGVAKQTATIELFEQSAGSDRDRRKVATSSIEIAGDGLPTDVVFSQTLKVPGEYEYIATVKLPEDSPAELSTEDNQRQRSIEVTDRKQRVLLISSGPMRDYRFVRNMLFRHSGIESDVWLQTVREEDIGFVSQEAKNLLTSFPKTEAELFEYDVIVAFDADWSQLSGEQQEFLNRWVAEHSGGIVFVAGELFTPELARDAEKYRDVAVLYPVVLNRMLAELKVTQRADTAWQVLLTDEGRASEFLKISDATGRADIDLWKKFKGIYRSYPVRSIRDGAIVLAKYGNPRARTQQGQPPFLATQFYGNGRTMFVSSAETWRLRSISAEGHQRFWTGLIREVGQGRRSRGRSRGLLLLDRSEASPGQSITIRCQLYDARMQPLVRESVPLSIVDADGRPVSVPENLTGDSRRPGQFVATFRPARQGQYRISVPVPESSDVLQSSIEVTVPNLESEDPSQNVRLLTSLVEGDSGHYLTLDSIASLTDLLPDRSEPIIVDERLVTMWDRQWVMFLMAGLLGIEWALRRVVRLS